MAFFYKNRRLHLGSPGEHSLTSQSATPSFNLDVITQRAERPTYVYDLDNIHLRGEALKAAFHDSHLSVHYALKANNHPAVLRLINEMGFGADTVSAGEIRLALAAGIPATRIIFSGVGKTVREIEFAVQTHIKQINVESPQELARIIEIARRLKLTSPVNVAFRMNPDVNPNTHPYITTGFRENKFGMDESFMPELTALLRGAEGVVRLRGLTMHIGSQLLDLSSVHDALDKILLVHERLTKDGFELDRIDIGGGIGVDYSTDDESMELSMIKAYGQKIQARLAQNPALKKLEILTEPGRILVARAGILLSEVQYIKKTPAKTFAIVNTGMHHLLRPALYGAKHRVLPLIKNDAASDTLDPMPVQTSMTELYDIVGPICESSDYLARDVRLAPLQQGDWLAIADVGAYGFTMANQYNAHELPAQIAIRHGTVIN